MKSKGAAKTIYVCSSCGRSFSRWMGRCPECEEWNTIVEEKVSVAKPTARTQRTDLLATPITELHGEMDQVVASGLREMDYLLGGGLVADSSILLGGEPGIGKSTLILQLAAMLGKQGLRTLYLSGEESVGQLGLRGRRLGVEADIVMVASARELPQVYSLIKTCDPFLVVIDSVQTLYDPDLESAPGTVSQIRSGAAELIDFCKADRRCLILIGHITKDGAIAGPKVLEHLVDVVLYFEGDANNFYRILRVRKNRFGPASEIGVFEIGEYGLTAPANPSELFLDPEAEDVSGRVIVTAVEGQRPLLLELQGLVTQTNFGFPQRVTSGYDPRRLSLMLAILEKRQKIPFGQRDVFVNLAGGLRIQDPALDLGLAAALISSIEEIPVREKTVVIGELGLAGEVRSVSQIERRVVEAVRLGFRHLILPRRQSGAIQTPSGVEITGIAHLSELAQAALA